MLPEHRFLTDRIAMSVATQRSLPEHRFLTDRIVMSAAAEVVA